MTIPVYGYTRSGKPIPASPRAPIVNTFTSADVQDAIDRLNAKINALVALDVQLDTTPWIGPPEWTHTRIARDVVALDSQIREYSARLAKGGAA